MNKEFKWYMIMCAVTFLAIFGAIAVDSIAKASCRAAGFANHATAEQIKETCN